MSEQVSNWAGNITFGARALHRPRSVDELQSLVAGSDRVRVLGSGHSFNRIADTSGDLISVADLPQEVDLDGDSVRISAGLRYAAVGKALQDKGFALHNLGSLPHISVAGACATGTHGSGVSNGSLPTAVRAVEMVTADGSLVTVSRGEPDFPGSVLALGALGVVTHLTLDIEPTYDIEQFVYLGLPRDELQRNFESVMASAYSVSLFTRWDPTQVDMAWLKRRVGRDGQAPGELWHGATRATRPMHPILELPGDEATQQLGVPGPWNARLPHFRIEFTPSVGDELQSEYFVARDVGLEAVAAVERLRALMAPVLIVSEIRTIARDDLWLSPMYERDTVALHFTWRNDTAAVLPVLTAIEEALAPFHARPHWGKVFTTAPQVVQKLYPRLPEFQALRARYDPQGTFTNDFLATYVG